MSLGVIPEYNGPTYAQIRNNTREDGSEWFSEECKEFFSGKLYETNEQYNAWKKFSINISWYFRSFLFALKYPKKIIRWIKLYFFKNNK